METLNIWYRLRRFACCAPFIWDVCVWRRIYQAVADVAVVLHNDADAFLTYSTKRLGAKRFFG